MDVLVGMLLVCAAWAVTASVLMMVELEKRGVSVNLMCSRLWIFKYLHQYRVVTQTETGRVGPLFYHYIVPLNLALLITFAMVLASV